ncbi:hypothetical protein DFS33DRAFT_1388599 [Desarmillaria ectypa]|nr:hypothetical protein DFS33DRAFT_1388599 [Desarmillaria ectypa]
MSIATLSILVLVSHSDMLVIKEDDFLQLAISAIHDFKGLGSWQELLTMTRTGGGARKSSQAFNISKATILWTPLTRP